MHRDHLMKKAESPTVSFKVKATGSKVCCCCNKLCFDDLSSQDGPGCFRITGESKKWSVLKIVHPKMNEKSKLQYLNMKSIRISRLHYATSDIEIYVDAEDGTKEICLRKDSLPHYELVTKKLTGISVDCGGLQAVNLPRKLITGPDRHFELQKKAMLTMFCKENKIPVTETIMTALFNLNAMLNVDCMISSENNIIEPKSGVEFKQRPLRPKT